VAISEVNKVDNDILINQARRLYAGLLVNQYILSFGNKARFARLDGLVDRAYGRYQRRLNRCVICYQHRLCDCPRDEHSRCGKANRGARAPDSSVR
jgi:hypothetical protein